MSNKTISVTDAEWNAAFRVFETYVDVEKLDRYGMSESWRGFMNLDADATYARESDGKVSPETARKVRMLNGPYGETVARAYRARQDSKGNLR